MRNYSGVIYFSALVCAHPLALIATRRRLFSFTHLSQSLFLSGHTFLVQTTPGRDDVQSGIQGVSKTLGGNILEGSAIFVEMSYVFRLFILHLVPGQGLNLKYVS